MKSITKNVLFGLSMTFATLAHGVKGDSTSAKNFSLDEAEKAKLDVMLGKLTKELKEDEDYINFDDTCIKIRNEYSSIFTRPEIEDYFEHSLKKAIATASIANKSNLEELKFLPHYFEYIKSFYANEFTFPIKEVLDKEAVRLMTYSKRSNKRIFTEDKAKEHDRLYKSFAHLEKLAMLLNRIKDHTNCQAKKKKEKRNINNKLFTNANTCYIETYNLHMNGFKHQKLLFSHFFFIHYLFYKNNHYIGNHILFYLFQDRLKDFIKIGIRLEFDEAFYFFKKLLINDCEETCTKKRKKTRDSVRDIIKLINLLAKENANTQLSITCFITFQLKEKILKNSKLLFGYKKAENLLSTYKKNIIHQPKILPYLGYELFLDYLSIFTKLETNIEFNRPKKMLNFNDPIKNLIDCFSIDCKTAEETLNRLIRLFFKEHMLANFIVARNIKGDLFVHQRHKVAINKKHSVKKFSLTFKQNDSLLKKIYLLKYISRTKDKNIFYVTQFIEAILEIYNNYETAEQYKDICFHLPREYNKGENKIFLSFPTKEELLLALINAYRQYKEVYLEEQKLIKPSKRKEDQLEEPVKKIVRNFIKTNYKNYKIDKNLFKKVYYNFLVTFCSSDCNSKKDFLLKKLGFKSDPKSLKSIIEKDEYLSENDKTILYLANGIEIDVSPSKKEENISTTNEEVSAQKVEEISTQQKEDEAIKQPEDSVFQAEDKKESIKAVEEVIIEEKIKDSKVEKKSPKKKKKTTFSNKNENKSTIRERLNQFLHPLRYIKNKCSNFFNLRKKGHVSKHLPEDFKEDNSNEETLQDEMKKRHKRSTGPYFCFYSVEDAYRALNEIYRKKIDTIKNWLLEKKEDCLVLVENLSKNDYGLTLLPNKIFGKEFLNKANRCVMMLKREEHRDDKYYINTLYMR